MKLSWKKFCCFGSIPSLCFLGRLEKQDGRLCLWLAETFSTSPLKLMDRIQRKLTGSKISTSSTKFVFFRPIQKQDGCLGLWLAETFLMLLLWNRWTVFNKTWQEAISQHLPSSLCFRANPKIKMVALASDWLRHFLLLLLNCWMEFNKTWQGSRSQRPLSSLCFLGRLEKQDGHPGLWMAETF